MLASNSIFVFVILQSPVLLLIFTAIVIEENLNYALIKVTFWIFSFLNLFVVISTLLPICDRAWVYTTDKIVSCLRSIRSNRNTNGYAQQQQNDILYCPGCCPCAFWPTPLQTLGTECATCCNFCFATFVCIACGVLLVWKKALKADYDECMKYSGDCNDDHLDNYKEDLAQWIIYFIFAVLLAFFNCCVGRNLFIYRISQAAHNESQFQSNVAVRPIISEAAVEPINASTTQTPPQPQPPISSLSDTNNNNEINAIEMAQLEAGQQPSQPPPPQQQIIIPGVVETKEEKEEEKEEKKENV